jgi:hypothetical protein
VLILKAIFRWTDVVLAGGRNNVVLVLSGRTILSCQVALELQKVMLDPDEIILLELFETILILPLQILILSVSNTIQLLEFDSLFIFNDCKLILQTFVEFGSDVLIFRELFVEFWVAVHIFNSTVSKFCENGFQGFCDKAITHF